MAKRNSTVHVATTRRHYKGKVYETTLLRRSYREGGKVRNETVGNLSHLPPEIIAAIRAMLSGRTLVDREEDLAIERSLPYGHVAAILAVLRSLDLERLVSRTRSKERDLVVAMIVQLLIAPGSKLSFTRRFGHSTLSEELQLGEVSEAELLAALDWLLSRKERIERALAARHVSAGGFALYDVSSTYLEGRCCPLAALGYSRDGRKGTLQVNWGLLCSPEGRPVAVEVYPGNTADPDTLAPTIAALEERFGIRQVILVGDRAMITETHAATLKKLGAGFISALKSAQIRTLFRQGDLQLSLFDEANLAEITSREFPGERLVVCRNPAMAAERARKRRELLSATEGELETVRRMVEGPRGRLRNADAGTIGERVGRVVNRYQVAKHFELRIADGTFSYARRSEQIAAEAALDGLYVLRTTCPVQELGPHAVVRLYKQLKMAERAYRTMKDALEVRPIRHHLADRVRAHFFLFMLAYYVLFELSERLRPLLYSDGCPQAPIDPVAPASRSEEARAKAGRGRSADGLPAMSLPDLIAELGTLCRNEVRIGTSEHTFSRLTAANAIQTKAFELLGVKLSA
jgi:hypothetical protein